MCVIQVKDVSSLIKNREIQTERCRCSVRIIYKLCVNREIRYNKTPKL